MCRGRRHPRAHRTPDGDGTAVLLISDNGSGIDPRDMKNIFDPFFTTKQAREGNGLGLSICYTIVKRAGRRHPGLQHPGQGHGCGGGPSLYMNVLIVDDEPGLRNGLAKLLALEGYTSQEAESAADARRILASTEVHLVLLDLRLGREDGLELLKALASEEPTIPVIIITGHGDIYSAVECMKAGATNYLPKPVDHDLLLSILEKERLALRDRLASTAFRESLRSTNRTQLAPSVSAEMKEIERVVEKVKDSDVPVLLLGETGTGQGGDRADHPLQRAVP